VNSSIGTAQRKILGLSREGKGIKRSRSDKGGKARTISADTIWVCRASNHERFAAPYFERRPRVVRDFVVLVGMGLI
jgi:hypothetical protein